MFKASKIKVFLILLVIIGISGLSFPEKASAIALCTDVGVPRIDIVINGTTYSSPGGGSATITGPTDFWYYTYADPSSSNQIWYPGGYNWYPGPSKAGHKLTVTGEGNIHADISQNCIGDPPYASIDVSVQFPPPPQVGNIHVVSNVSTSWTISGPNTIFDNGSDKTYTGQPVGTYSISPANLGGYNPPTVTVDPSSGNLSNGGTVTFYLNYTLIAPNPTADIWANGSNGPISVAYGSAVNIAWGSSNMDSCSVSPNGWGGTSGSQWETLTSSKTYSLNCSGPYGSRSDSVTVNIIISPPPTADLKCSL